MLKFFMTNKLSILHRLNVKNIVATLLILAGIVWLLFFRSGVHNKAAKTNIVPVKVVSVELKDMPLELKVAGSVVAKNTVAVRSRLDSQIMEIKFKDGDYVKKDQLLFVLDDRSLKAGLNGLQANLIRDKAQADNLKKQYERSKQLVKQGYDSYANLDTAQAEYEVAKANFKATDASIDNLKVQIEYAQIRAPISGRAGTINITLGNNVKANDTTPLVTINQIKPIRVQASFPQKYLEIIHERIKSGISVWVFDENGKKTSGKLEYVDNAVDQATGSFVAKAIFENEDEKLWPGMFVNLKINLGDEKSVITVPEVAVQHGQIGDFIFVIENKKAVKKDVKISRMQDGVAVVEDGLKEGDVVAVDGILFLRDGSEVSYEDK